MFETLILPEELKPSDPRFGVGPSLLPTEFIERLAATGSELLGTSHRRPAVVELTRQMQQGIEQYFNLPSDYLVAIGNGGASFLFDMIGTGMVEKASLHFTCGEFSEKWYRAHKNIPWLQVDQRAVEYGQGITPCDDAHYDMICCTLNETSTGVMIDQLPEVGEQTLLAVDATSGAGQIPCDLSRVDVYFFSAQKVFAGEGGFFVAILSPKAQARALALSDRAEYIPKIMDWKYAIETSRKHQTFNTPSISTIFYLNEQCKLMNELGEAKVVEQARVKAEFIYSWAESRPYLSCFVKETRYRSHAVATIDLDEQYSAKDLCQRLRDMGWVYDIEPYRKLGRNQFRISLFHNVSLSDLTKLTKIIDFAIQEQAVATR